MIPLHTPRAHVSIHVSQDAVTFIRYCPRLERDQLPSAKIRRAGGDTWIDEHGDGSYTITRTHYYRFDGVASENRVARWMERHKAQHMGSFYGTSYYYTEQL